MFDFPSSPSTGQIFAPTGGPSWVWDGTVWKNYQTQGDTQVVRTFIPGGSAAAVVYTYNKPSNLKMMEFEGVAAGGSAGPAINAAAGIWSFSSGGGGGSWGKKLFQAAALPASVAVTIGAPGQPSSSGNGNTAADTTFGSLITLPGGLRGFQGANTATSTWAAISGCGSTAMPTGVDVGKPGESSDQCTCGVSVAGGGITAVLGRAGRSPWGDTIYASQTTGQNSLAGVGYGWGSGPPVSAGNVALKPSVAGGPGAVLLTEYLAVSSDAGDQQIITPWVQYTPIFTGLGTVTGSAIFSRRVGDSLEIAGRFAAGTPTGVEARVSFGYNGVEGGLLADANKQPAATQAAGVGIPSTVGNNIVYTLSEPSAGYMTFGVQNAARSGLAKLIGTDLLGAGNTMSIRASVPIAGWLAKVPAAPALAERQTLAVASTGVIITVPPTAKAARISGRLFLGTTFTAAMRASPDGTTFPQASGDYNYGGQIFYAGTGTPNPSKVVPGASSVWVVIGAGHDAANIPTIFDAEMNVAKTGTHLYNCRCRATSFHSAAANQILDTMYLGYTQHASFAAVDRLAAIQIFPFSGTFGADSQVVVDWIY